LAALALWPALLVPATAWAAAGPGDGPTSAAAAVPVFRGERAMVWLDYQCGLGPRNPGSEGLRQLRRAILDHADSLQLASASLCYQQGDPYGPGQLEICNLVVSTRPLGGRRLWLGAHYDTRPRCDRDPDPSRREQPLLGANDGASGVAVLLHLAELLAAQSPPRGVDLIFFDAEDYGQEGRPGDYCLGSTYLAEHWEEFGSPLAQGKPEALIVLDMVGKSGLRITMEQYSQQYASAWTRAVFERARELGLAAFQPVPGPAIQDDHVPFLRAGIPAVDLIDFEYPQWHTTLDTPEYCSPASLQEVGRLVTDLAYRPPVPPPTR
jgi:glutaminyl-peptide cyclotransferase